MPSRYVPLLRTKAGEAIALQHLTDTAKSRILPLIHVSEKPAATFASRVAQVWTDRRWPLTASSIPMREARTPIS